MDDDFVDRRPRRRVVESQSLANLRLDPPRTESQPTNNEGVPLCCCGLECTQHGLRNATLKGLEKDVRDAARAGQALLVRHETYIAEFDAERSNLNSQVSRLDARNRELEASNAQLVTENSALLEQLDDLHNSARDSDAHVSTLTATLQSTQKEVDKLNKLTLRAESLEAELLQCEREQARLQATLTRSVEEERAAVQKWRASQRKIAELQDQIEDIEREAYEEATRHQEVVQRLERRIAVQNELQEHSAAASQDDAHERSKGEVVSSFVKEILQDNANMQIAMTELRDLIAYYKETELARTSSHQETFQDLDQPRNPSLEEELGLDQKQQQQRQRELHVHHHYHAPTAATQSSPRSKSQQAQRLKKRRPGLTSGRSTPTRVSQSPQRPPIRHSATTSTSSVGAFDHRISKQKRWSTQSSQSQSSLAISSGPSSPPSTSYCPSTIFERDMSGPTAFESRPTSPESNALGSSPTTTPQPGKLELGHSSFQPSSPLGRGNREGVWQPVQESAISTILEQSLEHSPVTPQPGRHSSASTAFQVPLSPTRSKSPRRGLRRTDSHTSLFSISGMDIHSTFPSPAHHPHLDASSNSRQNAATAITTTTAAAMKNSHLRRSSVLNRSLRGQLGSSSPATTSDHYIPLMDTFGKRVGGWLTTRLAGATSIGFARSTSASETETGKLTDLENSTSAQEEIQSSKTSGAKSAGASPLNIPAASLSAEGAATSPQSTQSLSPKRLFYRPAGVNQDGGLPPLPLPGGFRSMGKTPITRMMDQEALIECLGEDDAE